MNINVSVSLDERNSLMHFMAEKKDTTVPLMFSVGLYNNRSFD